MHNRRFDLNVTQDENGVVDICLSTNQDFKSELEYDDLVKRLKDVFTNQA